MQSSIWYQIKARNNNEVPHMPYFILGVHTKCHLHIFIFPRSKNVAFWWAFRTRCPSMCVPFILSSFNPAGELSPRFRTPPYALSGRFFALRGIRHLVRSARRASFARHHFADFTAGLHRASLCYGNRRVFITCVSLTGDKLHGLTQI